MAVYFLSIFCVKSTFLTNGNVNLLDCDSFFFLSCWLADNLHGNHEKSNCSQPPVGKCAASGSVLLCFSVLAFLGKYVFMINTGS